MRRALIGGFAIALSTVACSATSAKPTTGLEMVISADHLTAPADFDDIRLEVSQLSGSTWSKIWDRDYQVPSMEATLPTTFTVLGGRTADEVLIALTAYKGGAGGQPIVERVAQVQVPIDRLAALYLVLAQVCEGQVTSTGAEGEPTPTCPAGESCLPSTGRCGSDAIDANALPTFVPGQSLDAGPDAGDIVLMPGAETEAGGSYAGTEGHDATNSDAGGSDASPEAAGDASACLPEGTGAVATRGCPCTTAGAHACNGNAQNQALVCTSGSWTPNGICPTGQLCDTASGAQQGICVTIDPACTTAAPGDHVCSNATTVVQCGNDLASDSPVETCSGQACVNGMCTGTCAPGTTTCMDSGVLDLHDERRVWHRGALLRLDLHDGIVHGLVLRGRHAVLGQRRSRGVRERDVGTRRALHESGVRRKGLRGRLQPWRDGVHEHHGLRDVRYDG